MPARRTFFASALSSAVALTSLATGAKAAPHSQQADPAVLPLGGPVQVERIDVGQLAPIAAVDEVHVVLWLTNLLRASVGAAPLTLDARLSRAAQAYADVLATAGLNGDGTGVCFGHTCGPQPDLLDRVAATGYDGPSYTLWENVAAGHPTAEAVLLAWWQSPSHRAALLRPTAVTLGVGVAHGGPGPYRDYWTQVFGCRA